MQLFRIPLASDLPTGAISNRQIGIVYSLGETRYRMATDGDAMVIADDPLGFSLVLIVNR